MPNGLDQSRSKDGPCLNSGALARRWGRPICRKRSLVLRPLGEPSAVLSVIRKPLNAAIFGVQAARPDGEAAAARAGSGGRRPEPSHLLGGHRTENRTGRNGRAHIRTPESQQHARPLGAPPRGSTPREGGPRAKEGGAPTRGRQRQGPRGGRGEGLCGRRGLGGKQPRGHANRSWAAHQQRG